MTARTRALVGVLAVVVIVAVVAAVWKILQDDIWVDPSKGGLSPTRTSSGRATPDYSGFVADFLLDPDGQGVCGDGSNEPRCDYVLCRKNNWLSRTRLEYVEYVISPFPQDRGPVYPHYRVSMRTIDVQTADPYVEIDLLRIDHAGDEGTPVDLTCCEHDPAKPTCKGGPGPACGGSGIPLEMYFPHVTASEIRMKGVGESEVTFTRPEDIKKTYGLNQDDGCW